jgi:hypothetical protein
MDPNAKLAIEEFARQIREEINDGFAAVSVTSVSRNINVHIQFSCMLCRSCGF